MRRTKEDAEKTRDDILNAATTLFASQGVARTSLCEIAKGANVTRGAIYWHFKNKTEIFDALHERLHQPVAAMIAEGLEKDHPEPLQQLKDLCIKLFMDLEEDEQRRLALTLFMVKCDYSGDLAPYKEKHDAKKAEKMQNISRYIKKAKTKGKLPEGMNPDTLMLTFNCFMKGVLFEYLDNPAAFNFKKNGPKIFDTFFDRLIG